MHYLRFLFLLILPIILVFKLNAQESCSQKLKQAKELYESGQIETIPELLDSCLNLGFEKNDEIQAYILLIQTYLFDYNRDKALEVMYKFLKKFPVYKFPENSPVELKEIYDSYIVLPNWGFGFSAGSNLTQISSSQTYSVFNTSFLTSSYTQGFGLQSGIYIEKFFGKHFGISVNPVYKLIRYSNKELSENNTSSELKENIQLLSVPVNFNYTFGKNKIKPFLFLGSETAYLIQSTGNLTYIINFNGSEISNSSSQNLTSIRNSWLFSATGGLGVRYSLPKGYLNFRVGYNYSISNYINPNKRYSNTDAALNYGFIDDDIIFNNIYFSISFTHNLFKIRLKDKND